MIEKMCSAACRHAKAVRVGFGGEVFTAMPDGKTREVVCDLRKDGKRFHLGATACWRMAEK